MSCPPLPSLHTSFGTTRWTQVCLAKADSEEGRQALADLCDAYYRPVTTFLLGVLRDLDAANEMSHAFFASMLTGGTIHNANPENGRFRCYLLGAVKNFLSHQREAAFRMKRGGGMEMIPLENIEAQQATDPQLLAPDLAFDREWALTLLSRALSELQTQCEIEGRGIMFEKLHPWLTGDAIHGDQSELAASLGINLNSLRSQISRLKSRFRVLVRQQIAATLNEGSSIDEEMAILFASLRKN